MLNKEYLCPCGTQPLETERPVNVLDRLHIFLLIRKIILAKLNTVLGKLFRDVVMQLKQQRL